MAKKLKKYRVYIESTPYTHVIVSASDRDQAETKAKAKWRKDIRMPIVTSILEMKDGE